MKEDEASHRQSLVKGKYFFMMLQQKQLGPYKPAEPPDIGDVSLFQEPVSMFQLSGPIRGDGMKTGLRPGDE